MLGGIAGVTGALGAACAGIWLARGVLDLEHFAVPLAPMARAVLGTLLVAAALGMLGTRGLLRVSPLRILRQG